MPKCLRWEFREEGENGKKGPCVSLTNLRTDIDGRCAGIGRPFELLISSQQNTREKTAFRHHP